MKNNLPVILFSLFIEIASAQKLHPALHGHIPFPQKEINESLKEAYKNSSANSSLKPFSDNAPNQIEHSPFTVLNKIHQLNNPYEKQPDAGNSAQQYDTVFVGDVPHDTMVITGTYSHNGPIFVFNDGVLIFNHTIATNVGDLFVFGHGRVLADSSSIFFPQQYFYQRSLVVVQFGYVRMEACSLNYGGMSHNLLAADSAKIEMINVNNYDWTTAGTYGSPTIVLNGTNLAGEYIMSGNTSASFSNVNTLMIWHQFPNSSVINFSFPKGDTLYNYRFNNSVTGVSGINYNVKVDTSYNVWWGMMPVNGSDVTISNSTIRAIGAWFERGDSVKASGLVDNSSYGNFTTPLTDRNLHLINSDVQTWSLYVFDSSKVTISGCILGEVGSQGKSSVNSSNFFLDGSGGYFWATDTSFTVAGSVAVTSSVRSEHNGIFVFGYSTLNVGTASAIDNSVMIVVQSSLPQDPIPYDKSVAWYDNISLPSSGYVNAMVPVTGSAWIDQGPLGSWMDFASYSLYYQQQGDSILHPLVIDSTTEIRNNTLGLWNTNGLAAGNYLLHLILKSNLNDSVEAIKSVILLPSVLGISENDLNHLSLKISPDPMAGNASIEIDLQNTSHLKITIYDALGKEIEIIGDSEFKGGVHKFNFDASKYSPGIYFCKLTSEDKSISRMFIIQR